MRAVALLGPVAKEHHVRRFELPGISLFTGNELDPTDKPDAALIFGGDGTIHRHLGALAAKDIPTLIVPLGSANDFAASIGIDSVAAALAVWRRFCSHGDNTRSIDLGTIQSIENAEEPESAASSASPAADLGRDEASIGGGKQSQGEEPSPWRGESLDTVHFVPSGPRRNLPRLGPRIMQSQLRHATEAERERSQTTFFACIAGTGLDAAVNRLTLNQSGWLRGHGGYVVALLQVLGQFRPPDVTVSVQVDGAWQTRISEPGFLVAVGNGPQYGHGMRISHQARLDDGLLDVCFVRRLSKMRLLRLFRLVYKGAHLGLKEVVYFRADRVRLVTQPITEVFADGEYIGRTPVEIGLRRQALRVIVNCENS